jgi:hypothetical protein
MNIYNIKRETNSNQNDFFAVILCEVSAIWCEIRI